MGDEGPGEPEDTWIARQRTVGQLWQLTVVAGRQVGADLAYLRLDHVVVVQQPFGGRDHPAARSDFRGTCTVGQQQLGGVPAQPAVQRRHPGWLGADLLGRGEAARVLLQALDAEQFLAHGCSVRPRPLGRALKGEMKNGMHGRLSGRHGHARPRDQPAEKKMGKMALVEAAGRCGPARLSRLLGSPHRCRYGPGQDRGCRDCRHRFLLGLFQFPVTALLLFCRHEVLLLLRFQPAIASEGCAAVQQEAAGECVRKGRGSARRWRQSAGSGGVRPFGNNYIWWHAAAFQGSFLA